MMHLNLEEAQTQAAAEEAVVMLLSVAVLLDMQTILLGTLDGMSCPPPAVSGCGSEKRHLQVVGLRAAGMLAKVLTMAGLQEALRAVAPQDWGGWGITAVGPDSTGILEAVRRPEG